MPKSFSVSLMKPAWRASSRLMKANSSLDVRVLHPLLDLGVEHAAGELGGDAS